MFCLDLSHHARTFATSSLALRIGGSTDHDLSAIKKARDYLADARQGYEGQAPPVHRQVSYLDEMLHIIGEPKDANLEPLLMNTLHSWTM